ncbi:hypothetical protein SAMN04515647_3013 [Cohaesibacter sp. ES.047]|nr:hypothetical protein SAMN04515647_3013 [Cohaesibacter sp. ES.047]
MQVNTPVSILDLPPIVRDVEPGFRDPILFDYSQNNEGFTIFSAPGSMLSPMFNPVPTMAQTTQSTDTSGQNTEEPVDTLNKSMPSALTTPVLPNVPSSLPEGDGTAPTGETAPAVPPVMDPITAPAVDQETKPSEPAAPSEIGSEALDAPDASPSASNQAEDDARPPSSHRPVLRQSLSVLYTEQRPFLLYASDASITYLMPNAIVGNPSLSRYLRDILEQRALISWQEMRTERAAEATEAQTANAPSGKEIEAVERPSLVITGRVEDQFASSNYISLYLEEQRSLGDVGFPKTLLSFNYDLTSRSAFGLADLFRNETNNALNSVAQLLTAYIQADIVRQKSIRLGTQVTPQQDSWLSNMRPDLDFLSTFTLVPSRQNGQIAGLKFHFNPGLLGAEADGAYDVYVPAAIFAPSLAPRFADMFGGEAMMASRHYASGFSTASVNLAGLRSDADIGGDMVLEGEVPASWCDGFHLSLTDKNSGQIVAEAFVNKLPDVPSFGLADNMLRFRAELSAPGNGGTTGELVFEPYKIEVKNGRLQPRSGSVCRSDEEITPPDPEQDTVSVPVTY